MWNERNPIPDKAIHCGAVLAALILSPAVFLSQGAAPTLDREPADAVLRSSSSARAEQGPAVLALQRARLAGDEATMRQIESQRAGRAASMEGESAGGTTLLPTTTIGGAGLPDGIDAEGGGSDIQAGHPPHFGGDVKVRNDNHGTAEFSHCMASASTGRLFVAWEDDYYAPLNYIQVYHSDDGGASWSPFGWVMGAGATLSHPSIAVGEGGNGDTLILAYIKDDGVSIPVPEVATSSLTSGYFTVHSLPVWDFWEGYDKPIVQTDAVDWNTWYAYHPCEGIYDSGTSNINVCSWRSTDGGMTWGDEVVPFGVSDAYPWVDPDLSYGTTLNRVFLVTYREDDYTIYTSSCDDFGVTWNTSVAVATHSLLPGNDTDPEIEAAVNDDHVMMACTKQSGGDDDIGYSYSTDGGDTWSPFYRLPGDTEHDEFAVSLTANEGGGSWHLAYTSGQDHSVRYAHRPQDLSSIFMFGPWIIDDMGMAGSWSTYSRKGITSDWLTDTACIAWADARDNSPGDYDTFADFEGNRGLMSSQRMVYDDASATVRFELNAGVANAGRTYLMVGTFSGTEPGQWLPGGLVKLPLNIDDLSHLCLEMGPPVFSGFFGILTPSGTATAQLNIPADVGLIPGQIMHYAFAVMNPWDFASNAVMVSVSL